MRKWNGNLFVPYRSSFFTSRSLGTLDRQWILYRQSRLLQPCHCTECFVVVSDLLIGVCHTPRFLEGEDRCHHQIQVSWTPLLAFSQTLCQSTYNSEPTCAWINWKLSVDLTLLSVLQQFQPYKFMREGLSSRDAARQTNVLGAWEASLKLAGSCDVCQWVNNEGESVGWELAHPHITCAVNERSTVVTHAY